MKSVVIKGKLRDAIGKKDAKKLRKEENVPCVLYGGEEPIHFYAHFNEFRKVIYTPSVYLIDIDIDGKVYKALMQDTQWHAVHEQLLHVDFLSVLDDKKIKIEVPVKTEGLAVGIKAGGKLISNLRRLKVKAFAKDLPDTININVESLGIGQNVKVGDLKVDNVEFLDNNSSVVVGVAITRLAKAALAADEAEEAEGGEETTEEVAAE